jgi:hypothetical protein
MSQSIDRHVDLRALAPFVPVVSGPPAALGGRLHRAAVEDGGLGLGVPAGGEAENGAEVVDDGLEAAGGQPAAGLLIDQLLGREVGWQVAPAGTGADDPTQAVEDVLEAVDSLTGLLG